MKKISCICLCCLLLFFVGCEIANEEYVEDQGNTNQVSGTDQNGKPEMQQFKNYCQILYSGTGDSEEDFQSICQRGDMHNRPGFVSNIISPEPFMFEGYERLLKNALSDETIKHCNDWISCLYTNNYENAACMQANIENRYSFLSDSLKETLEKTNFAKTQAEQMCDGMRTYKPSSMGNAYNSKTYITNYRTKENALVHAITFRVSFEITSASGEYLPDFVVKKDMPFCFGSTISLDEHGTTYRVFQGFNIAICFDENYQTIVGWAEEYQKYSVTNQFRYLFAFPSGVKLTNQAFYYPPLLDDSFTKEPQMLTSSTNFNQVNELAGELTGYLFKLNYTTAGEDYFNGFLSDCDDRLKTALEQNGYFTNLLTDAKKDKVKVTLPPSAELSNYTKYVEIYKYANTQYGDVYSVKKNCHTKTGSQTFDETYGFGDERNTTNIEYFFIIKENAPKLIAFIIHNGQKEDDSILEEFWSSSNYHEG